MHKIIYRVAQKSKLLTQYNSLLFLSHPVYSIHHNVEPFFYRNKLWKHSFAKKHSCHYIVLQYNDSDNRGVYRREQLINIQFARYNNEQIGYLSAVHVEMHSPQTIIEKLI